MFPAVHRMHGWKIFIVEDLSLSLSIFFLSKICIYISRSPRMQQINFFVEFSEWLKLLARLRREKRFSLLKYSISESRTRGDGIEIVDAAIGEYSLVLEARDA